MRRGQAGTLFEQLFAYAIVAVYCAMLAVAFSQSLGLGLGMIGVTLAVALLIFAYACFRERREQRRREQGCRADLARAAAEHNAAIETVFIGRGEGGYAAFGVAVAAHKLIFARESYEKDRVRVHEFEQLAAAFARPDGKHRYRLEARARSGDKSPQRAALFVMVTQREEAERWVRVLQPHLGDRVRFVETADGPI